VCHIQAGWWVWLTRLWNVTFRLGDGFDWHGCGMSHSGWVMGFTSEPQRQPATATHKDATPISSETTTNAKVLQLKWVIVFSLMLRSKLNRPQIQNICSVCTSLYCNYWLQCFVKATEFQCIILSRVGLLNEICRMCDPRNMLYV